MGGIQFPSVESAVDGLLGMGGNLETDTLVTAYKRGIFPWPFSPDVPIAWFSPDPRGVLDQSHFHLPRSFKKFLKKHSFEIHYNRHFGEIIEECAEIPRKNQTETWITPDMQEAYKELFDMGLAWCSSCYDKDGLQGGMYGVCIDGILSAESMFHKKSNASKFCLVSLMERLEQVGIDWLDTQMITPVVASFGGREIPRSEFLQRLQEHPNFVSGRYFLLGKNLVKKLLHFFPRISICLFVVGKRNFEFFTIFCRLRVE